MAGFGDLGLRPELYASLQQIGFTEMTPIQAEALPLLLEGADVVGHARTGSGKTAAFGLALLQRLDVQINAPQALVLCPTRELAEQVAGELRRLAAQLADTRVLTLCGGRPYWGQTQALERGAHVVVGTPGRIGKHLRKGNLDLACVNTLVLDEADRMLDMGFFEQVAEIVQECPRDRQTLLFSATWPDEIAALSAEVQQDPHTVAVEARVAQETLRQQVYRCEPTERLSVLVDLLAAHDPSGALVFCETRDDCAKVAKALARAGAAALPLHGQMEQRDRDSALVRFANGSARVLVATNVAARGLDIAELPLVVVSELSHDPESHVHRIGRTGRAGASGLAITIVASHAEQRRLEALEAFLGHPLEAGPAVPHAERLDGLSSPNRTLLLLAGRRQKLRKGDVLGALVKDAGLPPEAIGQIDLMERTCAVAVARAYADQALRHLEAGKVKNRRIGAELL